MAWSPQQSACHWCMICQSLHSHNDLAAYLLFEREIGWLGHGVYILFPCNFQGILHHAPVLLLWATSIRNWKAFLVLEIKLNVAEVWFNSEYNVWRHGYGWCRKWIIWLSLLSVTFLVDWAAKLNIQWSYISHVHWLSMLALCGLKTICIYNFHLYIFWG